MVSCCRGSGGRMCDCRHYRGPGQEGGCSIPPPDGGTGRHPARQGGFGGTVTQATTKI